MPDSKELPLPPGLRTSRSEYGLEFILIPAFLHYWIGVSLDHAREVLGFFTKLELPKSQADSLLSQLASDCDEQYDTIAELIALQMIVSIDETGWKVGAKSCYMWVFSTMCTCSIVAASRGPRPKRRRAAASRSRASA